MPKIETLTFMPAEGVPNSPLPVVLYRDAFAPEAGLADRLERLYGENGWGGTWQNGIFNYHHYHDDAHEVLGIGAGEVTVQLGGEAGQTVTLQAGDVVVLPAGTGHKRLSASDDLVVVGGYPPGQESPAILKPTDEAGLAALAERCARVPLPPTDPIGGEVGTLVTLWQTVADRR